MSEREFTFAGMRVVTSERASPGEALLVPPLPRKPGESRVGYERRVLEASVRIVNLGGSDV